MAPDVCILAGGKGTRLWSHTTLPKALAPIGGQPFAKHQLRLLSEAGITKVVFCVGHLGEMVEAEIGDRFVGIDVSYSYDDEPGTANAVRKALPLLGEDFLVLNGDSYLPIDYQAVSDAFRKQLEPLMLTVFWQPGEPGNNVRYEQGRVTGYQRGSDWEWIDYGLSAMRPAALSEGQASLDDVYSALADRWMVAAYLVDEPFHEINTAEGLWDAERFILGRYAHQ